MAQEQLSADWKPTNFFETTLSADATDSDTDIFLSDVPTESEGTLVINPDSTTNREIIYYNSKTSTKVVCPSAALGRGYDGTTATSHTSGTKVIMAPIADWFNSMRTLFTTTPQGWTSMGATNSVTTGYNSGNRSFTIDTSADLSGTLSPGMRYKVTRGTTPPTQCADLEASSSQYASKSSPTGITFTDDFTCEAWVKLESYAKMYVVSRTDAGRNNGFGFNIEATGQVRLIGSSSSTSEYILSYQSIPLNKWVHIAASIDLSGNTGAIYIDGVSVPTSSTTGLTSLTNTGDLRIGATGGVIEHWDGKLADVRVWSDIRTETEIQDNMYGYPSDTTGLVAHFKLNGDFTDASSNGNDLTAQNSAVATDTDNPWNATEYGIITAVSASDIQVFCPVGYGIPNETLTSPFYSTQATPFGFPRGRDRWVVETISKDDSTSLTTATDNNAGNLSLTIPIGSWGIDYVVTVVATRTSSTAIKIYSLLSESSSSITGDYGETTHNITTGGATGTQILKPTLKGSKFVELSAEDILYLIVNGVWSSANIDTAESGNNNVHRIRAVCNYL